MPSGITARVRNHAGDVPVPPSATDSSEEAEVCKHKVNSIHTN